MTEFGLFIFAHIVAVCCGLSAFISVIVLITSLIDHDLRKGSTAAWSFWVFVTTLPAAIFAALVGAYIGAGM